jgi:hypothetical protein
VVSQLSIRASATVQDCELGVLQIEANVGWNRWLKFPSSARFVGLPGVISGLLTSYGPA